MRTMGARLPDAWYHDRVIVRARVAASSRLKLVPVLAVLAVLGVAHASCAPSSTPSSSAPTAAPATPEAAASGSALPGDPVVAAAGDVPSAPAVPSNDDGPGWLGVELAKPPPGEGGVMVRDVLRGSPAERAGLLPGDRILRVDTTPVDRPQDVVRSVSSRQAGDRIGLSLLRGGAERLIPVLLTGRPDADTLLKQAFLGGPPPAFRTLATVRGSVPTTLAELKGKVIVIDFWASWCVPCRMSVPTLNAWHDRYGAQGLVVIGVTMDSPEVALSASVEMGMEYAVASDPDGETTRVFKAFALPTMFVIDRDGKVQGALVGYSSDGLRRTENQLQALVSGRAAQPL
jgi:thiol-disulfide isomerase/thioredoxin